MRLLLIEAGASGAEEHAQRREGEHTVVIGQSSEELPTALAVRAVHHILVLERAGRQIESAVVLLAPRFDLEVTAARVEVLPRAAQTMRLPPLPCPPRRAVPALLGHRHRLRAVPDRR